MTRRWDREVHKEHKNLQARMGALQMVLEKKPHSSKHLEDLSCNILRTLGPDLELHLRKEEQVLFPALEKISSEASDEIRTFSRQHEKLRETVRYLAGLLCQCENRPDKADWKEITETSKKFVQLLQEHEGKEEKFLTHVLESSLKPQELVRLAQTFRTVAWDAFREEL